MHTPHFKSVSFSSPKSGVRVLISGAVHGNEVCGSIAIRRVIAEIESQELQLASGMVTFIPVTNTLAYQRGQRQGDRNLNRRLRPTEDPQEFEDHVANWLCPIMAQHQVLLDLHSFRAQGEAFVMVGPENNLGEVEPFQFADEEQNLAQRLGVQRFVDGWLSTYADGVARRKARSQTLNRAAPSHNSDAQFGVGTTEYMRSVDGYALTLECGQHQDPKAPEVAYQAILNTLRYLEVLAGEKPIANPQMEALRIYEVVDKHHLDDQFARPWSSFDCLQKGDLIGHRHDGTALIAQEDGRIIFPDANAAAEDEWFYLARSNPRLSE
jgi:predicted deacylase